MAKTPYTIDYAEGVSEDLANLHAYERKNILDAIDKQLLREPTRQTKNRKILVGLIPPWEHVPPGGNCALVSIEYSTMWTRKHLP